MTIARRNITAMKFTTIIHDRFVWSSNTLIMLPIPSNGAKIRVMNIIPRTFWSWFTSLVERVIKEDREISFSSWLENLNTFL